MLKKSISVLMALSMVLMLFCGCVNANDASIVPGTVYVSVERIYTNEWHNGWFTTLDKNVVIEENAIRFISPYGEEQTIPVEKWEWQDFPYTDEEWSALFTDPESYFDLEPYGKIMYQPLGDFSFMLLADGDIWLVFLSFVNTGNDCPLVLWSIDKLKPAEE